MNVYFFTLGCKVNQYETQAIKQVFFDKGFVITHGFQEADVFVINSCTVTGASDHKTKTQIRRFKKQNPQGIVALIGCFPQAFPEEAAQVLEADIIMGASNKMQLAQAVERFCREGEKIVDIRAHTKEDGFESMKISKFDGRTRAFVKIQDGCNRYCSYCIIPTSRGFLRSKPLKELEEEITELVRAGFQEIVLVGINLCFYGVEFEGKLLDAIQVVAGVPGVKRVRLGSLEPEMMVEEDIREMAKISSFCPQFHLSLQSGNQEVLKRMNRHYTPEAYKEIRDLLEKYFENPGFTTDVIVGFPGETPQEFQSSLDFLQDCKFSKVHVFSYSKRQGTRAAVMENQVTEQVKAQRNQMATQFAEQLRQDFLNTQVGKVEEVLFETLVREGVYEGYTKNYTPVQAEASEDIRKQIRSVQIETIEQGCCWGRVE